MPKTDKARQQDYRQRMQEQGFQQVALWLDNDSYTALQLLKKPDAVTRGGTGRKSTQPLHFTMR